MIASGCKEPARSMIPSELLERGGLIEEVIRKIKKPRSRRVISPCQGRHGKYLKNYSRKFHVGVLVSTWDLRHFVMPQISLCISENVCSRQSGTVLGSSRAELPCELPLASLLQIVPENVRNCKNGMYCSMAEHTSSPLLNLFREYISVFTIPQTPSTGQ